MGVASRAATPITVVASPLQRHGSRGDVRGPTSRTVTRNKQRWLCSERGVFPFGRRKEREERGGRVRGRRGEGGEGRIIGNGQCGRAERSVWFAAKLPATAQAPTTLFTFDEHRGRSTRLLLARCKIRREQLGELRRGHDNNACAFRFEKSAGSEEVEETFVALRIVVA